MTESFESMSEKKEATVSGGFVRFGFDF